MKPFHYRLQHLLHMREQTMDTALEAYAVAMQDWEHQLDNCRKIEIQISQIADKIQDNVRQGVSAQMLASFYGSMANAKQMLEESREIVLQKEKVKDEKHQEYLAKRGEFKALDNHRERKKEEHVFIQFKEEEKLLEELANNRSTYHSPFVTS